MRYSSKGMAPRGPSGFSLVELMVVVAIIAVMAAIAIPLFTKYVSRSKTSEAEEHLAKMKHGAVSYYLSDQKYSPSNGTEPWHPAGSGDKRPGMPVPSDERVFPGYDGSTSAVRTHDTIPKGEKLKPDYRQRADAFGNAMFDALNFSLSEPTYFVYLYQANKASVQFFACHDYKGKGTLSGYDCKNDNVDAHQMTLSCQLKDGVPQCGGVYTNNEFE